MPIPEWFAEQIQKRFGGRFRLRWSDVEHVYLFEQRVRRAIAEGFAPIKVKSARHRKLTYENQVRANEGYILSAKITAGTQVECPHCGHMMKVPVYKFGQVACEVCKAIGKKSVFAGGFFPLNDTLLNELDRTDPDRGGNERVLADVEASDKKREADALWNITAPAEAAFRERYLRIAGIPHVGLSGSVKMWDGAAESKPTWKSAE